MLPFPAPPTALPPSAWALCGSAVAASWAIGSYGGLVARCTSHRCNAANHHGNKIPDLGMPHVCPTRPTDHQATLRGCGRPCSTGNAPQKTSRNPKLTKYTLPMPPAFSSAVSLASCVLHAPCPWRANEVLLRTTTPQCLAQAATAMRACRQQSVLQSCIPTIYQDNASVVKRVPQAATTAAQS